MISILVATKTGALPGGLQHAPPHALISSTVLGWADAANHLLDVAAEIGDDALFIDDDATLTETTFARLAEYRDAADVFGFTLCDADGRPNSAGHVAVPGGWLLPRDRALAGTPCYIAHVSASCMYIGANVLRAGVRFPVWPGEHSEDVAFTYDVWLHGFKVAYIPGVVIHPLHAGTGATKALIPDLTARQAENAALLRAWMDARGVAAALADGRIPRGWLEIERVIA
jgi:GT2 family glycosyltransferase